MAQLKITPQRLTGFLLLVTGLLVLAHVIGLFFRFGLGHPSVYTLVPTFDLIVEHNAPTYFSALILLLAGFLLAAIGIAKRKTGQPFAWHWILLAIVFLFLSCDEVMVIHERLIPLMQRLFNATGWAYFAWIIPYGIGVGLLGLAYLPFLWALPRRYSVLFVLAGIIYVGGAIGLEALSADVYYRSDNPTDTPMFILWSSLEEVLEMLGVIVFIHALAGYISEQLQGLRLLLFTPADNGGIS